MHGDSAALQRQRQSLLLVHVDVALTFPWAWCQPIPFRAARDFARPAPLGRAR